MTKLATLRSRLTHLLRLRAIARLATAGAADALALLGVLGGMMLLDVIFEFSRGQRVVLLVAAAIVLVWSYRKFASPFLGTKESLIDVALLVERQQEIDSDLVAALQFESPPARDWGSPQLEQAVIDYVAEFGRGLNIFEGFDTRRMRRRLIALTVTVLLAGGVALLLPGHTAAFFARLAMSNRHYPTGTQLQRVVINGEAVELLPSHLVTARCPYGEPLEFTVTCGGELPAEGRVELQTAGGLQTTVILKRVDPPGDEQVIAKSTALPAAESVRHSSPATSRREAPAGALPDVQLVAHNEAAAAADLPKQDAAQPPASVAKGEHLPASQQGDAARQSAVYRGVLPRIIDTVECQFYLGDLWTEPSRIAVVPLPKVEFELVPVPPEYARDGEDAESGNASSRHLAVIAGSRIALTVECENKPLQDVALVIEDEEYPLEPIADDEKANAQEQSGPSMRWRLSDQETPLTEVRQPLAYEIAAVDTDGLRPARPIKGFIRIKDDRRPRIVGRVAVRQIVPDAQQEVEYEASDDYGLSAVRLRVQVQREDEMGGREETFTLRGEGKPLLRRNSDPWPLRGVYPLDLSPLALQKGDRLRLTLEATDFRGDLPGETAQSEPLVLVVTDRSGIYADLTKGDEKLLEEFSNVIQLQTGE